MSLRHPLEATADVFHSAIYRCLSMSLQRGRDSVLTRTNTHTETETETEKEAEIETETRTNTHTHTS